MQSKSKEVSAELEHSFAEAALDSVSEQLECIRVHLSRGMQQEIAGAAESLHAVSHSAAHGPGEPRVARN